MSYMREWVVSAFRKQQPTDPTVGPHIHGALAWELFMVGPYLDDLIGQTNDFSARTVYPRVYSSYIDYRIFSTNSIGFSYVNLLAYIDMLPELN